jgi:predicted  nucleic acid-binding Zn ribbon protein
MTQFEQELPLECTNCGDYYQFENEEGQFVCETCRLVKNSEEQELPQR